MTFKDLKLKNLYKTSKKAPVRKDWKLLTQKPSIVRIPIT